MANYVVYLSTAWGGFCVSHTRRFLEGRRYFSVPDTLSEKEILSRIHTAREMASRDGLVLDSVESLAAFLRSDDKDGVFGNISVERGIAIPHYGHLGDGERLTEEERRRNRYRYLSEGGRWRGKKRFFI